jgi:chorismate mutase
MADNDIRGWRKKIDDLDRRLVDLLNERARAAREIGRLKRTTQMPIYEPDREKIIFDNVAEANSGPLANNDLRQVYERIIDVMRKIQRDEITTRPEHATHETELDEND